MSDKQLLVIASASVYASQHFTRASEDHERLSTNNKMWKEWKITFLRAHCERARLIQAQGGGNFGIAHAATTNWGPLPPPTTNRLDSYLNNLANTATQDSVQMKLLVELNCTLSAQTRSLAKQLTALSTRFNAATPAPDTSIIPTTTCTGRNPAALLQKQLNKYSTTGYCHTHGYMIHANHSSATCNRTHPFNILLPKYQTISSLTPLMSQPSTQMTWAASQYNCSMATTTSCSQTTLAPTPS
jgi:hypothetical protein